MEIFDDMGEVLLGLFVEVGHSDTSSEDGIIRVFCCQICRRLGGEILYDFVSQYTGRAARVKTGGDYDVHQAQSW